MTAASDFIDCTMVTCESTLQIVLYYFSDIWGREFYAGIPVGPPGHVYSFTLIFLSRSPGQVNVTSPWTNFFISLNVDKGNTSTTLPDSLIHQHNKGSRQNKGVQIQSNVDMSVLLIISSSSFYGLICSTRLLPVSVLGQEYVLQVDSNRNISIVGVEATTVFNISFTDSKESHMKSRILNKFDTYFLNDASSNYAGGAIISSSKPIAVFSGSISRRSYLFEQIIPDYSWGYKYILPDVIEDIGTLHFRVFASNDNTNVHTFMNSESVTLNLSRGTYMQSTQLSGPIVLYANKPIMVMLSGLNYDYFLTTIPAISQFANACSFYLPNHVYSTSHAVVIFIKQVDLAGLTFNGRSFPEWKKTQYASLDGVEYAIVTWELLSVGSYYVTHTSAAARFGGFVFATNAQQRYTYGYPLDMVLDNNKPGKLKDAVLYEPLHMISNNVAF